MEGWESPAVCQLSRVVKWVCRHWHWSWTESCEFAACLFWQTIQFITGPWTSHLTLDLPTQNLCSFISLCCCFFPSSLPVLMASSSPLHPLNSSSTPWPPSQLLTFVIRHTCQKETAVFLSVRSFQFFSKIVFTKLATVPWSIMLLLRVCLSLTLPTTLQSSSSHCWKHAMIRDERHWGSELHHLRFTLSSHLPCHCGAVVATPQFSSNPCQGHSAT